jgi:formate hydrogenlyase transcriptional activator
MQSYEEIAALKARLEKENVYLQEEIRAEHNFEEIVGNSPALLELLQQLDQIAPTDSTVLISGETGTGKELIARAIHSRSARRSRPLVKVNCGAIPAGLVESELFGHVKGAFTGAMQSRTGRFELANGGTLFLDEVGELPLDTQVKLLRVLQEQEFEPVGSSRTIHVDVRIIAATNRDLEEAVRAGGFRSDVYYRLNVLPLRVPPLRERRTDIPKLVLFFLGRFSRKFGKKIDSVSQEIMDHFINYSWPGNIRELQNVVERCVALSRGAVLNLGNPSDTSAVPPYCSSGNEGAEETTAKPEDPRPSGLSSMDDVERNHIIAALHQTRWVIEGPNGAAKILQINPNTLRHRMKKLGIRRPTHHAS